MRILLTGSTGQVGSELLPVLKRMGEVIAPGRDELDLADPVAVDSLIRELRPRWIVNPAAYTAVDKAESEPELADAINHRSVGAMGLAAKAVGATVLHFSTDYVFDGEGTQPWRETDPTHPAGVYGASKLAGEQALIASGAAHLIFRTSWVYGATGRNFLRTIVGLARQREQMRIVADQHGAPTWSRDLANMAAHVIRFCEQGPSVAPLNGVYHAAGAGETTWFGFARRGIELRQPLEPETRFAELFPVPTSEYPTLARRPLNSRLDCRKLQQVFGWRMMDWQESLARVVTEL